MARAHPLIVLTLLVALINPVLDYRLGSNLSVLTVSLGDECPEDTVLATGTGQAFLSAISIRGGYCDIYTSYMSMLNTQTGVLQRIAVPTNGSLAVDDAANRVIVGGAHRVSILDARTGRLMHTTTLADEGSAPTVDAVTHRAFVLATRSVDVLDVSSGRLLRSVALDPYPETVTIAPGGARVFISGLDGLTILDGRSGRLVRAIHGVEAFAVAIDERTAHAFVPVNAQDARGLVRGALYILDTNTGIVLHTTSLALGGSADGQAAGGVILDHAHGHVFVNTGNRVIMIDARSGAILRAIIAIGAAAVDERTGRLFAINGLDGRVRIIDTGSGAILRTVSIGHGSIETWVGGSKAFPGPGTPLLDARSGRVFIPNTRDGRVDILDARSGVVLRTLHVGSGPAGWNPGPMVVAAALGRVFMAVNGSLAPSPQPWSLPVFTGRGSIAVLDARNGRVVFTIPMGPMPASVLVDERAKRVIIVNKGGLMAVGGGRPLRTRAVPASVSVLTM